MLGSGLTSCGDDLTYRLGNRVGRSKMKRSGRIRLRKNAEEWVRRSAVQGSAGGGARRAGRQNVKRVLVQSGAMVLAFMNRTISATSTASVPAAARAVYTVAPGVTATTSPDAARVIQ